MAKNSVTDWSEVAANNTDVSSVNIDEGCAPSGINNALRAIMAQVRTFFRSSEFRLRDGTDQSKLLAFNLSGITTGTTRTLTAPNANGTLPLLESAQNFTASQTIVSASAVGWLLDRDAMEGGVRASSDRIEVGSTGNVDTGIIRGGSLAAYIDSNLDFRNAAVNAGTTTVTGVVIGAPSRQSQFVRFQNPAAGFARTSDNGQIIQIYKDTTLVGSISTTGAATAYNTTSDENLKDFGAMYSGAAAAEIILADPVREFTWKASGEKDVGWGAQTSYAISPDLATPGEGLPGDEGYVPWGIDPGARVKYLWAAVGSLLGTVAALKAEVEELKK